MPNWCYNYTKITHENPAKIAELISAIEVHKWFSHYLPVPANLIEPIDPELAAKGVTTMGNAEYHWRVDNWGTKWDIGDVDTNDYSDTMLDLYFETAWSPPTGVYAAMKEQGYVITSEYWEEGGFFVGRWMDGEDECYEPDNAPDELSHLVAHTKWEDDEEAA